ncbi:hypothetical protein [Pseudemcibacter aquimaris]|uniref:ATP-binding protein n=1 Tax=Pseudemcibacter aquimaris TaxID=2857064 RepID=UPI0020114413|nr:hypothetical protein [Pseudemcibacter aquimaris]MCC3860191.1 hypothetical protein [Pseudemcibacter aquimaris]WDU57516.1 hypothetical protein KW060_09950 [Pseudemcibacter aquimaris]
MIYKNNQMNKNIDNISITYGATVRVNYKAVIIDNLEILTKKRPFTKVDHDKLCILLPAIITDKMSFDQTSDLHQLAKSLVWALYNFQSSNDFRIDVINNNDGTKSLCVEYITAEPIISIIKLVELIMGFLNSNENQVTNNLVQNVHAALNQISILLPIPLCQTMINAAISLKTPFYPIDVSASLVVYGQGKQSIFYDLTKNEFDSQIGCELQSDKTKSNNLLKIMGYPVTEQYLATNSSMCHAIINKIGFPVVFKPPQGKLGNGITSNINSMQEIDQAFQYAARYSDGAVLIEKFVSGIDYRITVSDGVINGITENLPAYIIGDGINPIQELISIENNTRKKANSDERTIKPISIDQRLVSHLKRSNLSLTSVPDNGQQVFLRANSNIATGGIRNVLNQSEVHPDNLEMAIDIARIFRLNSIGIDFMTPDISKSWKEMGTIIEINTTPLLTEEMAKNMLKNQFSSRNGGRIPTALILSENSDFSNIYQQNTNIYTGIINNQVTKFNGNQPVPSKNTIYHRCLSLLPNPKLEGLIITMTPDDLKSEGLPLDRFDKCIIDKSCDYEPFVTLLKNNCENFEIS